MKMKSFKKILMIMFVAVAPVLSSQLGTMAETLGEPGLENIRTQIQGEPWIKADGNPKNGSHPANLNPSTTREAMRGDINQYLQQYQNRSGSNRTSASLSQYNPYQFRW